MTVQSITTGPRQSNFELLRIVAMFLVLIVHADFSSIGEPTINEFDPNPVSSTLRVFFESISIVCVNVFILISGWFGIKQSLKSFGNFLFQCFFFFGGTYFLLLIIGRVSLSLTDLIGCLGFNNWFVMSYLGLFILAPILNSFLDQCNKKQLGTIILTFYAFQSICGWPGFVRYFDMGYSAISFVGLYLIGRYLKMSNESSTHTFPQLLNWMGFGICSICLTGLYIIQVYSGVKLGVFSYINPLVVISSIFLFRLFSGLKLGYNYILNFIARSVFSVFLLNTQTYLFEHVFKSTVKDIYYNYDGFVCLLMLFSYIIGFFIAAILLDQPRKWLWKALLFLKK